MNTAFWNYFKAVRNARPYEYRNEPDFDYMVLYEWRSAQVLTAGLVRAAMFSAACQSKSRAVNVCFQMKGVGEEIPHLAAIEQELYDDRIFAPACCRVLIDPSPKGIHRFNVSLYASYEIALSRIDAATLAFETGSY